MALVGEYAVALASRFFLNDSEVSKPCECRDDGGECPESPSERPTARIACCD
jgi:hypothetical protein